MCIRAVLLCTKIKVRTQKVRTVQRRQFCQDGLPLLSLGDKKCLKSEILPFIVLVVKIAENILIGSIPIRLNENYSTINY